METQKNEKEVIFRAITDNNGNNIYINATNFDIASISPTNIPGLSEVIISRGKGFYSQKVKLPTNEIIQALSIKTT